MSTQNQDSLSTVVPYRRERHIDVEPVLTAIGVVALVLLVGGWRPMAEPVQHDAPSQLVSVKTASATR